MKIHSFDDNWFRRGAVVLRAFADLFRSQSIIGSHRVLDLPEVAQINHTSDHVPALHYSLRVIFLAQS